MTRILPASRLALALGLLTATGIAQRTWIVDAANGPGTDFTDLPPALTAATAGDRIVIRAGSYTGGATEKPLRLVAEPGAGLSVFNSLIVRRLPAGTAFEISGLRIESAPFGFGLHVLDNLGVVTLRDLTGPPLTPVTVALRNNEYVALSGHMPPVYATDSTLAVSSASIAPSGTGQDALKAIDCTIFVSDSTLTGGPGSPSGNPLASGPGTGIYVTGGTLRISGTVVAQGGPAMGLNPRNAYGLAARDSDVTIDPGATFVGTLGPAIWTLGGQLTYVPVPGLGVTSAPPGGTVQAALTAPAGTPAVLAASAFAAVAPSVFGMLVLDPLSTVTVTSGTTSPQGVLGASIPVPPTASLRGTPVHFQGIVALPGLELTTPASIVLH